MPHEQMSGFSEMRHGIRRHGTGKGKKEGRTARACVTTGKAAQRRQPTFLMNGGFFLRKSFLAEYASNRSMSVSAALSETSNSRSCTKEKGTDTDRCSCTPKICGVCSGGRTEFQSCKRVRTRMTSSGKYDLCAWQGGADVPFIILSAMPRPDPCVRQFRRESVRRQRLKAY